MFGEDPSESPRLPSPWLSRSSGGTPSPLPHLTPERTPATPKDHAGGGDRARGRSSREDVELLQGLAEDFDAISLSKGKLSSSPRTEEIALVDGKLEGLQPEVDHKGHIEYKLKLLTPTSLHRLEKLRTQLKWRLTQGGGEAVYELGLLDDGQLVGLNQRDMDESLQTLGTMLSGLGGGHVQVSRVVRIGSGGNGTPGAPLSPTSTLFPSFDVPAAPNDHTFVYPSCRPSYVPPRDETLPLFPPEKQRGPTPVPSNRTAEEQAIFRRDKRDQRRARRAAMQGVSHAPSPSSALSTASSPSSASSSTVSSPSPDTSSALPSPIAIPPPLRAWDPSRPKPPKPPREHRPPRRERRTKTPPGMESLFKPVMPGDARADPDEVRWVLEAIVRKAQSAGAADADGRRRKSSAAGRSPPLALEGVDGGEVSEEALTSAAEEDERTEEDSEGDNDEEGWSYLEFDLAAAAAAAVGSGRAGGALSVGA
ncbi:hypothetical protein JCM10213_006369 [Rhodosporidiobolus nylandii]